MSDTSSILSSSESDLFDEERGELLGSFKYKKTDHFIKKLFDREIGLCQLRPKFSTPPHRFKFPLHKTLPTVTLHSHIFLGISSCGQLLITYTYTTDFDDRPISFNTIFKYRLHWWAFVPYAEARKVAEVTLFGNCYVYTPLYLAYCQWPRDSSKIVVFGRSGPSDNGLVTQNERSYVTVTAVPSLQNCEECQKVAASFEEEDIAASWDSCARLNCLVHGLTVHTSFDMAPPYPKFVATTSMKNTGRVVLNSGNFLHVIRVGLENVFKAKSSGKSPESGHLQSEQFSFRSATSNLNVRFSEYQNQALIGLDSSVSHGISSDLASDTCSIAEELNIISQGYVGSSTRELCCQTDSLTLETDSDASSQRSSILSPPLRRRAHAPLPVRGQQGRLCSKVDAGKAYDFNEQKDERIYESLSSFRKRRLADKKYEFSEEDTEDSENLVPFRLSRHADVPMCPSSTYPLPPSPLAYPPKDRNSSRTTNSIGDAAGATSPLRWKSFAKTGNGGSPGETSDMHSAGSIFIDPNVEPDKVVLRPHNRNHLLLSPRDQDLTQEISKKSMSIHPENHTLSSTTTLLLSPQSQPMRCSSEKNEKPCSESYSMISSGTGLNTGDVFKNTIPSRSSCSAKWIDPMKPIDCMKSPDFSRSNDLSEGEALWSKGRCTVQFERRFIEVDDELVSVITDIEDDDESGSTGYHSALPLEVHGTGYVQMQMISNSKAEKLMAPCALVHQMSFDIEQFCHEVAEVLCKKAGMKFWFCNNYDVEIVDVCPQSADVICLAYMKIKATLKSKGVPKSKRLTNDRQQYQTSCLFVWNMNTSMYRVERSRPLERLESGSQDEPELLDMKELHYVPGSPEQSGDDWNPAREEAYELRTNSVLNNWGANQPPVKVMSNDPVLREKSLEEIIHAETGISFVL